jgi:hypothetical protein
LSASTNARNNSHLLDPVNGDEVPKVDDAIAVGEDLAFQERWWTFERLVWFGFCAILLADVLGVFGAGWLAHARVEEPGLGMDVRYDRVARTGTPTTLAIQFGTDAAATGNVVLIASDSVVKGLGAQRVIPQPAATSIAAGSMTYTFPAGNPPGEVDFELQPGTPGIYQFTLQVQGHPSVTRRVVVMP